MSAQSYSSPGIRSQFPQLLRQPGHEARIPQLCAVVCKLDHGSTHDLGINHDQKLPRQNIAIVNADRNSMVLNRRTYVVSKKENQKSENAL